MGLAAPWRLPRGRKARVQTKPRGEFEVRGASGSATGSGEKRVTVGSGEGCDIGVSRMGEAHVEFLEKSGVVYGIARGNCARVRGQGARMLEGVQYALGKRTEMELLGEGGDVVEVVQLEAKSAPDRVDESDFGLQAFKQQFKASASQEVLEQLEGGEGKED